MDQRTAKGWITKALKLVETGKDEREFIINSAKIKYGNNMSIILKDLISSMEEGKFYCGRCMRFLSKEKFKTFQLEKFKVGSNGYCEDCSLSKIEAVIDIDNAKIVRKVPEKTIRLQEPEREKSLSTITETIENWLNSPDDASFIELVKNVIDAKEGKTYVEIIVKKPVEDFHFFSAFSCLNKMDMRGHVIFFGFIEKRILDDLNELKSMAVSVSVTG